MSSSSPATRPKDGSARRKKVKNAGLSVAERLKMAKIKGPIRVRTDIEECSDEEEEESDRQYDEDEEYIDKRVDKKNVPQNLDAYEQSTLRIVAQYLDTLGLKESVDKLVEESGCTVENSQAVKLKNAIMKGNYEVAFQTLDKCCPRYLTVEASRDVKFQLECFKIANYLRKKRILDAIYSLREMTSNIDEDDTHKMNIVSALVKEVLSIKDIEDIDLKEMRKSQIETIQRTIPTSFMLPGNRLKEILKLAHGKAESSKSQLLLKDDGSAAKKRRKYKCAQILNGHDSEVWIVKFSPDGKYLVSGSKSNNLILWKSVNGKLSRLGRLEEISDGYISYIEWSPGNKYVAICGTTQDKYHLVIFDVAMRSVYRTIRVALATDEANQLLTAGTYYTCCSFFQAKYSTKFIAANEQGMMRVYNIAAPDEAHLLKTITGFRIRCLYGFKDEKRILASDSHNRLRIYHTDNETEYTVLTEESSVVTFTVHSSEQLVLITTSVNLRLWDLKTRTLIRYFSGACQQDLVCKYVIHATLGGILHGLIATGTIGDPLPNASRTAENQGRKDGRVCVWSFDDCRPLFKMKGHKGHVNAVTWNPRDPTMVVSCSDDGTVRVWSLARDIVDGTSSVIPKRVRRPSEFKVNDHNQDHEHDDDNDNVNDYEQGNGNSRNGGESSDRRESPDISHWANPRSSAASYPYFTSRLDCELDWIEKAVARR